MDNVAKISPRARLELPMKIEVSSSPDAFGIRLELDLELRPDGQLDQHGIHENFQLPVAGAYERFTAAEFIERLALLNQDPGLYESIVADFKTDAISTEDDQEN